MTFADRLKELRERATKGKWRVLDDCGGDAGGLQFGKDGGVFLHVAMPNRSGNVEIIAYLANHAEQIEALVRAAERHCVKRMLDDDHELREALAALNEEKS